MGSFISEKPVIAISDILAKLLMKRDLTIWFLAIEDVFAELFEVGDDLWWVFGLVIIWPCTFDAIVPILFEFDGSATKLTSYYLNLVSELAMIDPDMIDNFFCGSNSFLYFAL